MVHASPSESLQFLSPQPNKNGASSPFTLQNLPPELVAALPLSLQTILWFLKEGVEPHIISDFLMERRRIAKAASELGTPLGSEFTAKQLWHAKFNPPRFIVPQIIPEGLTLFVGAPKLGKSFMCHALALAVATGGKAFGSIDVEQGEVLYASLEDGPRRLHHRLHLLEPNLEPSGLENLSYMTNLKLLDQGGLEMLERWFDKHPRAKLALIDTYVKVQPEGLGRSLYRDDHRSLDCLQKFASERQSGLTVVHHDRKASSEDYFDQVSGTKGLTGAADTVLVLQNTKRGDRAYLRGAGRDLDKPINLAFKRDPLTGGWLLLGDADEVQTSESREKVIVALEEHGPCTPRDLAALLGIERAAVKQMLFRMKGDGKVISEDGYYRLAELR
jgi:hypothetical protein